MPARLPDSARAKPRLPRTSPAAVAPLIAAPAAMAASPVPVGPGQPAQPQSPDRELRQLLREIDRDRIEATVRRLAAFGTRHTLSHQDHPARGIGAARDWVYQRLLEYAAPSGGRMTVELQSFRQPPTPPRIPTETVITNVVATLRGSVTPERMYVITGHYDSRCSDVMDSPATPRALTTTRPGWPYSWNWLG